MSNATRLLFIGESITDAGRDAEGELTPWKRFHELEASH